MNNNNNNNNIDDEEEEEEEEEEEVTQESFDAFKKRIEKRLLQSSYLKRVHLDEGDGSPFWLNVLLFSHYDVEHQLLNAKQNEFPIKIKDWFRYIYGLNEILLYSKKDHLIKLKKLEVYNFCWDIYLKLANDKKKKWNENIKTLLVENNILKEEDVGMLTDIYTEEIIFPLNYFRVAFSIFDTLAEFYLQFKKLNKEDITYRLLALFVKIDKYFEENLIVDISNILNEFSVQLSRSALYSSDSIYALNKFLHT
eukprot:TRINITY_DN854_c1_g5_i1.p1 TRINITY_DN854_c1_g5~~TRINITY_DN854_c1_g5_i1.p1  ORF type:complete len:253 (-),score=70.20 TRINITY_DN854_c1_g5_i1:12-770(-)